MAKLKLVYTVEVDSDDDETAKEYLTALRETFRMISEELVAWGYTQDEIFSSSVVTGVDDLLEPLDPFNGIQ